MFLPKKEIGLTMAIFDKMTLRLVFYFFKYINTL